jgi:hypothetical protein
MVQDGLFYSYTHKQFQEYYTAVFINGCEPTAQRRFIKRIAPDFSPNDVLRILYEMNPQLVEHYFTLPAINRILKTVGYKGDVNDECFARFWKLQVRSLTYANDSIVFDVTAANLLNFIRFVQSAYFGVVSLKAAPTVVQTHETLRDIMKAYAGDQKSYFCDFNKLLDHGDVLKVLKSFHVLNIDQFRYLVDVRDFIAHRQGKRSSSIDDILGGKKVTRAAAG